MLRCLCLTLVLLNAASTAFEQKWLVKIPQEGYHQLMFLQSVANLLNRLLEQQAVSSSEAAATGVYAWPARSRSKRTFASSAETEPNTSSNNDSDAAYADRVAKSMLRLGYKGSSLVSQACGSLLDMPENDRLRAIMDQSQKHEDADAVTYNGIDHKYMEHKGALHELLPSWPTPNKTALAETQAVAWRCLVTLEWIHAETQRKLTLIDCFYSAQAEGLKTELIMLLHKLLLGHLQNDQLDMLNLVSLGMHSVTQAVFTFPACVPGVNELCCAFALRFATDQRLIDHEDEGILGFWSPGRAGVQALWTMLSKLLLQNVAKPIFCFLQVEVSSLE